MEPFKNAISPDVVRVTATLLAQRLQGFDVDRFVHRLIAQLDGLELKQRVALIAEALNAELPVHASERYAILLDMLHPDVESKTVESSDLGLTGWAVWPLTHLVATHGQDDFDAALAALKEMTKRFTSEFDVRPFIIADQGRALAEICSWVEDPSPHVRRLVSEGTRPRLPWGIQLKGLVADPSPSLPALERLRDDPSEYVRRSVANHLNDIAKDHPDLVAALARDWLRGASKEREKLLRHACRTLIKQGHAGALAVFGLHPPEIDPPDIKLRDVAVRFGGALEFDVNLSSTSLTSQTLVVDYVLHFLKANGTLAPKVFKWSKLELKPNERRDMSRSHKIKPITTRKYYDGAQALSLRINGKDFGRVGFELTGVTVI